VTLVVSPQGYMADLPYRSYGSPLSGTIAVKRLGYDPLGSLTDAGPPDGAAPTNDRLAYEIQISGATLTSTEDMSGGLYPPSATVDAAMDWVYFNKL
jgi:hypothetical protein